ncbi:helix-turn-helix transcriptional regulator [Phenylobacterium sp.]|uniref:helix-turn-helix transcriptional regulator n=1 Tax=Phenylobacterium sp. TaxID=1871053 RepID=UPI003BAD60BB
MRRADRLFQIIQILRRARRPVTADALAEELETSKRTVYRDVADLMAQRVPVRGEAGIGYVLDQGYDLPPLMLTPDEIEAAVLGAQWVAGRGDPALARAAEDLIAKISAAIPERLRPYIDAPSLGAATSWKIHPDAIDMAQVRAQIHAGRKISIHYKDEQGRDSQRVIWPVTIGYHDTVRMLMAWCEMRQDFRSFRADRVTGAEFMEDRYPERPAVLRAKWRRVMEERRAEDIERMEARHAARVAAAEGRDG